MTKPYTDADVELVACAHLDADQRRVVAEHAHLPLLPARWSDLTPGQRAVYTDDARAVLDALAAAGRLTPVDDDPRHIVEFRPDGWTIKHPLACRPNLFDCPVNRAAETELGTRRCPPAPPGRYECRVGDGDLAGMFLIVGCVEQEG